MKIKLIIFILILTLFVLNTIAVNPGFKTTLTQNGINYAKDVALDLLKNKLSSISIKEVSGSTHVSVLGTVDYYLTDITITGLTLPLSSVKTVPNVGLDIIIEEVSCHVTLNWHYRQNGWPHISGSGSADISISKTDVNVEVAITETSGHPYLRTKESDVSIGSFSIELHGGASWLYNLLVHLFENSLKDTIQTTLSQEITTEINTMADNALKTLPLEQDIGCCLELDYALDENPYFGSSYFTAFEEGEFFAKAHPSNTPFVAPTMPDTVGSDMLQLFISDYMLNSAGYAAWQAGILKTTITPSMVPSNSPVKLNTTDFSQFIPPLYQKYPGKLMTLDCSVVNTPMSFFNTTGIYVVAQANAATYVELSTGLTYVFTIGAKITLGGDVTLKGTTVSGKLTFLSADLSLNKTAIGNFSVTNLQDLIDFMVQALLPTFNQEIASGIKLPVIDYIYLLDPSVKIENNYISVSTDFQYKPPASFASRPELDAAIRNL